MNQINVTFDYVLSFNNGGSGTKFYNAFYTVRYAVVTLDNGLVHDFKCLYLVAVFCNIFVLDD